MRPAASSALRPSSVIAKRDQVGDADSGRPGTEDHDLLVDQAATGDPYAGQHAGEPDGSGALDVVVERAERVAVPGEDAARRRTGEVLPVQDRLREPLARARDVGVDELVVPLSAHTRATQAEVARVVEQLFAVGADVETDRQHAARVDAGGDGVDGELADRDVDSPDTPVADAEDGFGVGRDDQVDVVRSESGGLQGLVDAVRVIDVQEDATRSPEQVAELLDRGPDRRRVDDREHRVHVLADESVEEHLVAVVQLGEEDPPVDIGLAGLELLERPGHLFFERLDP